VSPHLKQSLGRLVHVVELITSEVCFDCLRTGRGAHCARACLESDAVGCGDLDCEVARCLLNDDFSRHSH
jgi:hypothetical protein